MKKICLQAGHWNKAGAGAPNERDTNKRITDRVSALCRERGIEVYQTDYFGFNDEKVTKVDFDLFLALHCDMDYPNDGGSGFADFCEPSKDGNTKESQRITKIINDNYFKEVKINYVNHSNKNTRFYYMWDYLTPKTPCVLLEMGQSVDPHDSVLLGNTDLIAKAITRSICLALNVSYEINSPNVSEYTVTATQFNALKGQFDELKRTLDKRIIDFPYSVADCEAKCQEKLLAYKKDLVKIINS